MPNFSPTLARKLAYAVLIVAILAGCFALMTVGNGGWGLMAFVFVLLVPGRVQGVAFRDFFRGRRLFAEGKFAESIPHFKRFLERIRRRPALKRLIWLQWTVYTTDVEVMTLNNLGGAHVQTGDLETGERYLREALRLDPRYAMAYYNLYVIATLRGDDAQAEHMRAEARSRGLSGGLVDQVLQRASAGLAHLEGRGGSPPPHP